MGHLHDCEKEMAQATIIEDATIRFRKSWQTEFGKQANAFRNRSTWKNFWHGATAYREFHRTGNLWRVDPVAEPEQVFVSKLTSELLKQVATYKRLRDELDGQRFRTTECYDAACEALLRAEVILRKVPFGDASVQPYLSKQLGRSVDALRRMRNELKKSLDSHWQRELLAPARDRARWPVYVDGERNVDSILPDEVKQWEQAFNQVRSPKPLAKRIDLDQEFQLRTAVVLRHFIPRSCGVSLQTISRLVVLTYICGELAQEENSRLVVGRVTGNRKLTPGAVVQKLQFAKIK